MITITEDYVSFEIAKLLKKKGFDWYTYTYYEDENNPNISLRASKPINWNKTEFISKPTLQMAMKWLRKVHNLYIDIRININNSLYSFKIYSVGISGARAFTDYHIKSYEATCELAIKYCLEKLI